MKYNILLLYKMLLFNGFLCIIRTLVLNLNFEILYLLAEICKLKYKKKKKSGYQYKTDGVIVLILEGQR
jgi:hypothetical protein